MRWSNNNIGPVIQTLLQKENIHTRTVPISVHCYFSSSRSWRVLMVLFFSLLLWITYFSVLNWNSEQFLLLKRSYPTRRIKQNAVSDETCDNYTRQKRYIQFNYVGLDFDLDHNAPAIGRQNSIFYSDGNVQVKVMQW